MKVTNKLVYTQLEKLYQEATTLHIGREDKVVIFSDLHMGNGGSNDDFKPNSHLFTYALENHYLNKSFNLILNGDIEELQKFKLKKIHEQWKKVIEIFKEFHKKGKLFKTVGNHDLQLSLINQDKLPFPTLESLKLIFEEQEMFIFHGHQASKKYQKHNQLVGFTLKYFANPLRIKNYSVSHDSRKQYKIEKIAYHYAAYKKIIAIIGHTHRPLFESMDKKDRIRFKIEQLCRDYAKTKSDYTANAIKALKQGLRKIYKREPGYIQNPFMYNSLFHLPTLFNSGTVIGKRGMTCLEIENGKISLVHWFDKKISKKYLKSDEVKSTQLDNTDYYRMVINTDDLNYIFTRVKLLS